MIVVVEGVSAAGKSTWCKAHARGVTVPELRFPDPQSALGLDEERAASFWSHVNAARWRLALDMEAQNGTAVCDSDPFKLHYAWCLWRIGAAPRERFLLEAEETRERFMEGTQGFADLVLFKDIDAETLRQRRESDTSRRRGKFDLHARMIAPLREWYQALDEVRPGHVQFDLPEIALPSLPQVLRPERSDLSLLEEFLERVS